MEEVNKLSLLRLKSLYVIYMHGKGFLRPVIKYRSNVHSYPEVVLLELTTSWIFLPFSSERNFVPLVGNNRYIITLTSSRNVYVLSVQLQQFLLLDAGCGGDLLLWMTLNVISQKT